MIEVRCALAALLWFGLTGQAFTEGTEPSPASVVPPEAIYRAANFANDLKFPDVAERPGELTVPRMTLLKPAGAGPFPAVVMMHQCAGLNAAVLEWARRAVVQNYVVLVVDSLGPRGVKTVCYGPRAGVNLFRGTRDALQASEHLRRQPFVNKDRVALVGFSWGAMVGLLASSRHYARALDAGPDFAAVASFYPGCFRISPPNGARPFDIVNADIAPPALVLMGDADTETPAAECVEKLDAAKRAGAPIEWHVYPQTTHCWDCKHIDGFSKTDVRGNHVVYRFQQAVTDDSARRLFEFLNKVLPRR